MRALVTRIDAINQRHPWSHNDHYIPWILRQVPAGTTHALDAGCGTGTLLRSLSGRIPQVDGIDRDPRVAALAGAAEADLLDLPPRPTYDLITAVAVVHHLPLVPALTQLRALLRPGGRLLIVGCYRPSTVADHAVGLAAIPTNLVLGLARSRHADQARLSMSAPTAPPKETLQEVRTTARILLPGATIHRRLFWRYTLTWTTPT